MRHFGIENDPIPNYVLMSVIKDLSKTTTIEDLTRADVEHVLQKNGHSEWCKHSVKIYKMIIGDESRPTNEEIEQMTNSVMQRSKYIQSLTQTKDAHKWFVKVFAQDEYC
jgi:hypothetical protein